MCSIEYLGRYVILIFYLQGSYHVFLPGLMTITKLYEYVKGEGSKSATPRYYRVPQKTRYQYD